MITSGWMPNERSSRTECCVGLVFSSWLAFRYGSSVTWTDIVSAGPDWWRIWLIASRNGCPSMSPTVPPTSTITTSASSAWPAARMRRWISLVTCGIAWIVPPRKSPRRSLRITSS